MANFNNTLESICVIGIFIIIVIIVVYHYKRVEGFTESNLTPEDIIKGSRVLDVMDKQQKLITDLKEHRSASQLVKYLPHLDVINAYRQKSNQVLGTLKDQVNENTDDKNRMIDRMENNIASLMRYKNDRYMQELSNTDFKAIQSHNNGSKLSINRIGFNVYQVQLNGGCLSVTPENNYAIAPCDPMDKRQHFRLEHIFNEMDYRNAMNKGYPQLENLGNVHYPFTLIKSKANDNCLKQFHGALTVEPCREYEGQRWAALKSPLKC